MMKIGASSVDQREINKMAAAGKTAAEISAAMQIEESCVASFMPKKADSTKKE